MNESVFRVLNSLAEITWLQPIVVFLATNFIYVVAVLTFIIIVWPLVAGGRDRRQVLPALEAAVLAGFLSLAVKTILKYLFATGRPFVLLPNVILLIDPPTDNAFPSGHTMLLAALAAAVYPYRPKLGIFLALSALVVGLARIIVGVHFPGDIAAGYLFGLVVGWLAYVFVRKVNVGRA